MKLICMWCDWEIPHDENQHEMVTPEFQDGYDMSVVQSIGKKEWKSKGSEFYAGYLAATKSWLTE